MYFWLLYLQSYFYCSFEHGRNLLSNSLFLTNSFSSVHWGDFIQRLHLLEINSSGLRNSNIITSEMLQQLTSDSRVVLSRECKTSSQQEFHAVMAFGFLSSNNPSDIWLPLDLVLEDAMDGYQVNPTSAVEIVTGKSNHSLRI